MRHQRLLLLVLVLVLLSPPAAHSHGGGMINLNPCSRTGGRKEPLTVHLDAFQQGKGPFCYHVPEAGKAQLVLEINKQRRDTPTTIRIRRSGSPSGDIVYNPGTQIYPGGLFSRLISFPEPGRYDVIVDQPQLETELVFPVYVGVDAPWQRRLYDAVIDTIEKPYVILFVLMVVLGFGWYRYRT